MNKNYYDLNLNMYKTRQQTHEQLFERQSGENKFSLPLINYTLVNEKLANISECDGVFPRWLASTRLINPQA